MKRITINANTSLKFIRNKGFYLLALLTTAFASAQVTLIDPAGDGGFENGATFAANGWTAVNAPNGNRSWYIGTAQAGYTGARGAFIGNSNTNVGSSPGARTVHLYRAVTVPAGAENIQLSFKYKQAVSDVDGEDIFDYIAVYLSNATPTNGDLPAGTPVFGPFPDADLPAFTQQAVMLPNSIAGTTTNLIFTFKADNNDPAAYGALDDVSLTYEVPTCAGPSNLSVIAASESATLTWAAAPTVPAAGYQYAVTETNTAPATGTATTGLTGTVVDLGPNTTYYAWVRSDCGGGDAGSWRMYQFTTPCDAATVPYVLDFEEVTVPALPDCTTIQNAGLGNNWITDNPEDSGFDTNALVYEYNADEPANAWFFTQGISLTAGTSYRLTYSYGVASATYPEKMKVAFGSAANASAMSTQLADHPEMINATAPITHTVDFSPATTGVYYIGFNAYSDADMFDIYVDDISVNLSPSCISPSALAVNAASTSVTLSWPASLSNPQGYDYAVTETDTPPATFNDTAALTAQVTTLAPNTPYFAWVRSNCGAGDTGEWISIAFTTPCDAVNVPYVEDFESVTEPDLPACTTNENAGSGSDWETMIPDESGFDTNALVYTYDSDFDADAWFFTRGVNLTAGTSYRLTYTYGAGSEFFEEKMNVYYGMQNNAAAMLTQLADHPSVVNDEEPITHTVDFVPATTGVYYFGFHAYSEADQYTLYVDDISVDVSPSCLTPLDVAVSNVGLDSATLSWTAPSVVPAQGYEFYISETNSAPDATTDGTDEAGTTVSLTVQPNTTYYVWVRSICGTADASAWSPVVSFSTLCNAANVPYVVDFEDAVLPALPPCTANENVGTGSDWMTYFPDDYGFETNVLAYSYDSDEPANVWFFTNGVNLTAGVTYKIAYDYGNAGGTTFPEKMKVAYGTARNATGMETVLADHANIVNDDTPINNEVEFTPAATGIYYFGFNAYSEADQLDLYVDNIVVDAALATGGFDMEGLSYYPNPVKNVLNLSYATDITGVEVYNMLGQQVHVQDVNAATAIIDLTALTDGAYLLKITAGNSLKIVKVIKKQ